MLKITKGLKPFVEEGITSYMDDKGNEYVRVNIDKEDFCIASHYYIKNGKEWFKWDEAMKSLKEDGFTTFNKKQMSIYIKYRSEITDKLKEIGGEVIETERYWTSEEYSDDRAWAYIKYMNRIDTVNKNYELRVRPIINL